MLTFLLISIVLLVRRSLHAKQIIKPLIIIIPRVLLTRTEIHSFHIRKPANFYCFPKTVPKKIIKVPPSVHDCRRHD